MAEKSPLRMACVRVVAKFVSVCRELNPSKFDMKNSRFFPLNSFGIRTGPPSVKPYWFWRYGLLLGEGLVALRVAELKS